MMRRSIFVCLKSLIHGLLVSRWAMIYLAVMDESLPAQNVRRWSVSVDSVTVIFYLNCKSHHDNGPFQSLTVAT